MKTLVVYYSRTGTTERVARRLARELRASLLPITEKRSRLGFFGYQRSALEAVLGRSPRIHATRLDPADFDRVVIGTPIWAWHLSSPVRAFARRHARDIRRAAYFCTMGGSGAEAAFQELEQILGAKPEAVMALTEAEVEPQGELIAARSKISRFVKALQRLEAGDETVPSAAVAVPHRRAA